MGSCGADAREAIRRADSAMYAAKRAGGDRMVFFSGSRRTHEGRRLALGRELRDADTRGELGIVFQPVFELATNEIVGRRGTAALGQPHARRGAAGRVHPGRGGRRIDRADRGLGAARELRDDPADRRAGRATRRTVGERVRAPARPPGLRAVGPADPLARRVPRGSADARDRRGGADPRRCGHRAYAARARVPRHPHRARRLRDGRFLAVVAEGAPGQRDQDRPQFHRRPRRTTPAIRRSCPRWSRCRGPSDARSPGRASKRWSNSRRYVRSTASALRASCSPVRCRRRSSRRCSSTTTWSLFSRQQPPLGLLTPVRQLELNITVSQRLDSPIVQRCFGSP